MLSGSPKAAQLVKCLDQALDPDGVNSKANTFSYSKNH